MLDNEMEVQKIRTNRKLSRSHVRAKNFETLKTSVNSTNAAKFKDEERRADKIPHRRITRSNVKELMMKLPN